MAIESSTISGNLAGTHGAIYNAFGGGVFIAGLSHGVRIVNSTISGNHADGSGGGIHTSGSSLAVRLTTISGNTAGFRGGSLLVSPVAGVQLNHSIAANGTPQDLATEPAGATAAVTASFSLIEAPGAGDVTVTGSGNRLGIDPLLGPLASNGGPTLTHRPLPGSPAIDAGDPMITDPPAADQRDAARIAGAAVDLGAVEVNGNALEVPALAPAGLLALGALLAAAGLRRLRRHPEKR